MLWNILNSTIFLPSSINLSADSFVKEKMAAIYLGKRKKKAALLNSCEIRLDCPDFANIGSLSPFYHVTSNTHCTFLVDLELKMTLETYSVLILFYSGPIEEKSKLIVTLRLLS